MTDPAATTDPMVGTILDGRYRLERVLGRGGMGRVYGAEHVGLGRPVAIKVLDPSLVADDNARKRFEREAQSTGRLRNANCVGVTDFGAMPDGSPYLAMELVEGMTLDEVLDSETRLPAVRAIHIMRHLLRGLAHAHAQGVVHRDLKPCNIMLVTEGEDHDFAKILDFGLARLVGGGGDRLTQVGIVCGTPRYMAPEQVLDGVLGPPVDLYAASVILFEMLTGRTPFDADEATRILRMHLKDPVPAMAALAPDANVPAAVEAVVRRGLAKAAADRPTSADHYLAELDRALGQAPTREVRARSPILRVATEPVVRIASTVARTWPTLARRHKIAIGAALAAIVLVIAIVVGGGESSTPPVAAATAAPIDDVPELEMGPVPTLDPEITEALRLARSGRGQDAVRRLKALQDERPHDAQVPYALGRVYDGLGWPKQTIESYRAAIQIDPALRENPALIRDLVDLLDSRSTWQLASRTLEQEIGAPAVAELSSTAAGHASPTVRERAARIRDRLVPR